MTFIIQRKVKNAIYVYEGTSYRNQQGKPRNKQRYLGKLDSDGVLITRKRRLPAKIREVKTVTRRFILHGTSHEGHIIRRKVKNAIYVYEGRNYRNRQGKPRNKQRYLGKLDSDGVLITRKRRLPAKIREVKTVTRRFILHGTSHEGHIIRRKVKNAIYVYEGTSYRNRQGKPRNKQRYLGKLDSDGILITRKRRLPAQIREVKTVTRRFILEDISPSCTAQTARISDTPASANDTPRVHAQSYSHVPPDTETQELLTRTPRKSLLHYTSPARLRLVSLPCSREYQPETPSSSGQTAAHMLQSSPLRQAMPANIRLSHRGQVLTA